MSVNYKQQYKQESGTKNKEKDKSHHKLSEQDIYEKFQKAHENMSNFQEMLTKFSTHRKPNIQPRVHAFSSNENLHSKESIKTLTIALQEGWQYTGQIFQDKFHGYGNLLAEGSTIYTGGFKNGQMDGIGKLNYNQFFYKWEKYEGQFKDGNITGYGNLFLNNGMIIIGYWRRGKPQYYTKIQNQSFIN